MLKSYKVTNETQVTRGFLLIKRRHTHMFWPNGVNAEVFCQYTELLVHYFLELAT